MAVIAVMGAIFALNIFITLFYWFFILLIKNQIFRKFLTGCYTFSFILIISFLIFSHFEKSNDFAIKDVIFFSLLNSVTYIFTFIVFLINKKYGEKIKSIKPLRITFEILRWVIITLLIIFIFYILKK